MSICTGVPNKVPRDSIFKAKITRKKSIALKENVHPLLFLVPRFRFLHSLENKKTKQKTPQGLPYLEMQRQYFNSTFRFQCHFLNYYVWAGVYNLG